LLVPVTGSADPHLPDLPAQPVTLPKAVKAARYAQKKGAKSHKVATKQVVRKKTAAAGKRVTVKVPTPAPAARKVVVASNP
ncbi:MAG: hypothetical protein Q8L40_07100, partial [Burkholderiales bacterium]|nr:hypothetical protein [Burkholderiales bacterium]